MKKRSQINLQQRYHCSKMIEYRVEKVAQKIWKKELKSQMARLLNDISIDEDTPETAFWNAIAIEDEE